MKAPPKAAIAITAVVAMGSWDCERGQLRPCASAPSPALGSATAVAVAPAKKSLALLEIHEQVAAEILAGLRDHDFDAVERHFDARMKQEVPKEKVGRVWSQAVAATGEMTSWALIERDSQGGYDRLRYRLNHEQGNWEALITFAPDASDVAGLLIRTPTATTHP
jgi:hypothetical protein